MAGNHFRYSLFTGSRDLMPIKIFHSADLHIGLKFSSGNYSTPVREALKEARFTTLSQMVREAGKRNCQMMAIAGDLFDHIRPTKFEIRRVVQELKTFSGDITVVLPGNHDPLSGDFWKTFKDEAGDRILLLEELHPYDLQEFGVKAILYPGPCMEKHSDPGFNQIGWIKDVPKGSGVLHIGIAHGSLEGVSPDDDKLYYLMTRAQLESAGVSLWLMGHNHSPYPLTPGLQDKIFYPGSHEPDSFNRSYPGSAWIHELFDEGTLKSERLITGQYRFLQQDIVLEGEEDILKLKEGISLDWEPSNTLLKLSLKGRLTPEELAETREILNLSGKQYLYFETDEEALGQKITPESIHKEFSKDSFPHRLLQSLSQEGDSDSLQLAYELLQEMKGAR